MKEIHTRAPTLEDYAMMRRVHDRACKAAGIEWHGARGQQLAKFIAEEFAMGNRDEESLSEFAVWLVRRRKASAVLTDYRVDISVYVLH
ncbi:hypothetical protein [Ensifer sp.]|uniref:hypothetical protein n=1 Tax=Ensifer sp. TaxID=1872086 RepID=UPI0028968B99|nr:hypothetical protein [Ensifer sp.]